LATSSADRRLKAILDSISRDEVIDLARSLVQIPSITGREGLEISRFMAAWLERNGLEAGIQEVGPERANVYARVPGTGPAPRLLLNGHLDTKPGDNMTIDPFGGELKDGRLYGRGSCDMKGPVAAEMIATAAIARAARSGARLGGTLVFGSEVGEDGGGWKFNELIDGPGACDIGICGEPTKLQLHIGCRGGYPLRVRTIGRATHTGTAYQGINAIEKMCAVVPALYALPCFHQVDSLWGRSPINAMVIQGGGKVSASVPDECTVQFDIRLNPDLPPDEVEVAIDAELTRLQAADPQLKLEVEKGRMVGGRMWRGRPAAHLSPDDPLVGTVREAIEEATGHQTELAGFPGGCSTMLMLERGIKSVIYGPGDLEQAHSADEWVDVEQLYQAARAYASIAYRLLSIRDR
jgi:acetylornithine deacetylase/succinyl-diaminopimelate desuccinylase-like protein